jgi:hypothetical protein
MKINLTRKLAPVASDRVQGIHQSPVIGILSLCYQFNFRFWESSFKFEHGRLSHSRGFELQSRRG